MTPEELIIAAKSGNREAMSVLLMDHRRLIAAAVSRFISDPEQRKDVIQRVFLRVIKHMHQFVGRCRFSTWLYRICFNESIEYGRSEQRTRQRTSTLYDDAIDLVDPNAPDALAHLSSKELQSDIGSIMQRMPLDRRTVFSLFYFGGYSGREIAEVLHITESNVFMKLKAARDDVKGALSAKGWTA